MKIHEICEHYRLANVLVKDESTNPFGTWKDRRSELIVRRAVRERVDTLCLITSGNAGYSLANFAREYRTAIISIVDRHLSRSIKQTLKDACTKVIETNLADTILTPEAVTALARERSNEVIWDVTNGFHEAYESVIEEVTSVEPAYLVCPVGSGEGFVGLYNGLERAKLRTRLIGVAPESNPSVADKLHTPWTPYRERIRSILERGHTILTLSEDEIRSAHTLAREWMNCEPSSAVVIGALSKLDCGASDTVVVINSGKGLVDLPSQ